MDPFTIFKMFINGGGTPQQVLERMILGNNSNPMISNLMNMAKSGKSQDVENFARNIFKEKGRDFDKEFAEFKQKLR